MYAFMRHWQREHVGVVIERIRVGCGRERGVHVEPKRERFRLTADMAE